MVEKTEEIELSTSNSGAGREGSSRLERANDSRRAEECKQAERDNFERVSSSRGRGLPAPFVVHENVFRVNVFPESVDGLRTWIVDAATESNSSEHDTFSFPAVHVIMSSAWVDATTAVEALRKRKGTPYVMWGEAVEEFQQYFQEKHHKPLQDAAGVLQRAMENQEAAGTVILSLRDESSPALDDMIHLDPRWLIELVRRLTDHNLVDKSKQPQIKAELIAYCRTRPRSVAMRRDIWAAHTSFINHGQLDREYLRFLWLHRTLEDKDTYSGVKLDNSSFESMLNTMIKCLFIYRSNSTSEDGREWFVVPARLGEYGDENILENEIWFGEAVVQTTLIFHRTHALCGIIGRFLAFSAKKINSSRACWQHGAHILWERNHEVLVFERLVQEESGVCPGIAICVKGTTQEATCVRDEVKETLFSLLKDAVYGYPGVFLPDVNDSEPMNSNELQRVIRPYMDIQFASLRERLEEISHKLSRMFRSAFPESRHRTEFPRLVLLVPDEVAEDPLGPADEQTPQAGIPEEQAPEAESPGEQDPTRGVVLMRHTWDRWVRLCYDRCGRRSFHLVFLCEHNLSEVRCGPEGKGYPIKDVAPLFKTLKPLLQASLWLVKVAVGVVANVDLPLDKMLAALMHATAAEIVDNVAGVSTPDCGQPLFNADAGHSEGQTKEFKDLHGPAYESLCKFMRKAERKQRAGCSKILPGLCKKLTARTMVDWRDYMVQVENGVGGWAWVRTENKAAYCLRNVDP